MKNKLFKSLSSGFAITIMLLALVAGYFIYNKLLGNPLNFVGNDPSKAPIDGNVLGTIHKGGQIVILQITFILILITYIIERGIMLWLAGGSLNNKSFALKMGTLIRKDQIEKAIDAAKKQKGAVANVIHKGLHVYQDNMVGSIHTDTEKAYILKSELEEASHLEVPVLERNMIIISTLASIATLIGLLGTVTGMIKAFGALAKSGTPDAIGLAGGISQALVTTAMGISTAAVAIVFYNLYTNKIDQITYAIDEVNYKLLHHFKEKVEEKATGEN